MMGTVFSRRKVYIYLSILILVILLCCGCLLSDGTSGDSADSKNVKKTIEIPEGSYTGFVKNGKPHGEGILLYKDGGKYTGEFKSGKRSGQGEMVEADGSVYVGTYKNDQKSGEGTYCFPDGKQYKGSFSHDLFDGRGEMSWPDGVRYVGEWDKGQLAGSETYNWPFKKAPIDNDENNDELPANHSLQGFFLGDEPYHPVY
ncbi:MAG: hypothetical protein GX887_00445 [Firmicutes bacterium]|nr:hypothetical protein [Bacillota bacterium]